MRLQYQSVYPVRFLLIVIQKRRSEFQSNLGMVAIDEPIRSQLNGVSRVVKSFVIPVAVCRVRH